MKNIALLLLLAATVVYIAATVLTHQLPHPAWPYVAASAEAAMVGALADWFAVVALFRHPMGLRIPHTAVIASNKDRIGQGLANFLDANFLAREQVAARIKSLNAAAWLAHWLQQPENAKKWVHPFLATMRFGMKALDEASVQQFMARNAQAALQQMDFASSAGAVLDSLTAENRHQTLLDEVLLNLGEWLKNEETQQYINDAVAQEVRALRYVALDKIASRQATKKIIAVIGRNISDMSGNPEHPLRLRFHTATQTLIKNLKSDPDLRERINALRDDMIQHPYLQQYLREIWRDLQQWIDQDLQSEHSRLRQTLEQQSLQWGQYLQDNAPLQDWINQQVQTMVPQVVQHYRPAFKSYIRTRIDAWDTSELVREVETHVGKDLQFIRINGTLVGALVGLAIYSLTQWAIHAW